MESFIEGIYIGITVSLLVGPLLFALVETTLSNGRNAGFTFALGMWISDVVLIAFFIMASDYLAQLSKSSTFEFWTEMVGAIILTLFGIGLLFRKQPTEDQIHPRFSPAGAIKHFLRGFTINSLNPFTIFFWIGISSIYFLQFESKSSMVIQFVSGLLGTVIIADILKVFLAQKISKRLNPKAISLISMFCGIALLIFALYLMSRLIF